MTVVATTIRTRLDCGNAMSEADMRVKKAGFRNLAAAPLIKRSGPFQAQPAPTPLRLRA